MFIKTIIRIYSTSNIVNTDRIQKQAIIAFINLSPKINIHSIIMTIIACSL